MRKASLNILIIGGGVAGMAAAQTFADQEVIVHLVEKNSTLGGHAAEWACMATESCENCGACLSIEMADQVQKQKNVISHLNTIVETINKKNIGYEVILEDKTSFNVEKIIMATGFSPFNPVQINSFHYNEYKNVITTADLNTILQEETLSRYFNKKTDPKIAFIQCVGSRNREQGRDYCSQVCCKISMRHANKLTHLFPESDITLFHMDLQVIGKEIRSLFNRLSKNIALVQGVPAEILEDSQTNMLTIVAEDKETQARVSKTFDLIILSVGMQPSSSLEATAGILDLKPNSWGFFNTDQAALSKDVVIAGCANGPKDILTSKQDGRMAAAKVINDLGLNTKNKLNIAVFGEGGKADQTVEAISSKGHATYLFGPGKNRSNDRSIISISGTAGNFSLYYESKNEKKYLTCEAIIAAFEPEQSLNRLEGLTNESLSLDAFSQIVEKTPENCPDNSVILLDYFGPEFKSFARLALETSIKAKALGKNISIIMNKMLVHGALGQRLYDTARKQGVDFFRFESSEDLKFENSGNGFLIKLKEATLPSIEMDINCDCLVLPSSLTPARGFKDAADLLHQSLDKEGFLQSANTRHRLTGSPRKGIFFAGTCHDETDQDDLNNEINDILAGFSTKDFDWSGVKTGLDTGVEINQEMCAQCLTCIRICPHSAIIMNENNRPQIVPDSCFSCHLCVSSCPAYAIESKALTNDQIAQKVEKDKMVILACERSAALAAGSLALPDHITLIPIPCACRISSDVILRSLLNGASKVIVAGCHEENCRSLEGSSVADASVRQVLSIPGMEPSKVVWEPIAANETKKFERIISKA